MRFAKVKEVSIKKGKWRRVGVFALKSSQARLLKDFRSPTAVQILSLNRTMRSALARIKPVDTIKTVKSGFD